MTSQAAARIADGEAHFRRLGLNTKLLKQADEVGIGPVVEDDEPGVDGVTLLVDFDIDGVGMAADPVAGLKHRDFVTPGQQIGRYQAGNTAADNCNAH